MELERAADRARVAIAPLDTPSQVRIGTVGASAVILTVHAFTARHVAALDPSVRVIGRAGVGLDAIDLDAARRRGIAVIHVPGAATEEVATHAVALLLALNRRLLDGDAIARRDWASWPSLKPLLPLASVTVGIVGAGRIGKAIAGRLGSLVREIIVFDPYAPPPPGARPAADLMSLLRMSNVVILSVPLRPDTKGLISADQIAAMPKNSLLINVSRGGVIDEDALCDALHEGHLGGAGLDVLQNEPPRPGARILDAPRTLLTPHVAWLSSASEVRLREQIVDAVLEYLACGRSTIGRVGNGPILPP